MASKPRVQCHKEKKPSSDKGNTVQKERFLSAADFMKEFSFSIDSEDSKRFTNNFVDFPITDFKSPDSPEFSATLVTTGSLQDLRTKSDTQLQSTISENFNSLQLSKFKQQSLTDVTTDKLITKKTQKKTAPKPRYPDFSSAKKDRKPPDPKVQVHSKDRLAVHASDSKSKSRPTIRKCSVSTSEDPQHAPFDSSRAQHTRPPIDVTVVGRPHAPSGSSASLSNRLELQNGLLASAVFLNLSAQRASAEAEKEALSQLSKLHSYKQKLLKENRELQSKEKQLEINLMAQFALGELGNVDEVLTTLKVAGAQMLKMNEALTKAQSSVTLKNVHISQRDRDNCEKHLRNLSTAATSSLTTIRTMLSNVYEVCDQVQIVTKEREEDLKRVREASEELERYVAIMLKKISLEAHAKLLEENIDMMKHPEKLHIDFPSKY